MPVFRKSNEMSEKESHDYPDGIIEGQPFAVEHIIIPVYLYASWQAVESILFSGELKASVPEKCNDLCDMLPRWQNDEEKRRFIRLWENNYRAMFCFSLTPNSTMMWGHYADRGKGAVLKFDLPVFRKRDEQPQLGEHVGRPGRPILRIGTETEPFQNGEWIDVANLFMQKVRYSETRPEYSPIIEVFSDYIDFLSTKGKEWELEKEVRIVAGRRNSFLRVRNGDYFTDKLMRYLSGICIGPRASVRRDYVERLLVSVPPEKSAVWNKTDAEFIQKAEISPTHYSIISGWQETPGDIFEKIPELKCQELVDRFCPVES